MTKSMRSSFLVVLTSGLLLAVWLLLSTIARADRDLATFRFVAADGDCGINTPCYDQVQAAVDAASDGDEIRVAAGLYTGINSRHGTDQLIYLDKTLTLRGGYHPQTWAPDPTASPTILDAEGLGRVLFISGTIAPVVEGFHLTNGSAPSGGGVYVDTAAPRLSYNEIYSNGSEFRGGGLYLENSAATISSNHIYSNTTGDAGQGGGLALSDSPATVDGNTIEDNRAHVGGGIVLNNSMGAGGATLTGNTIRDNVAFDLEQNGTTFDGAGGGIDLKSALTDTLRNNVISGNTAKWGGGVHAFGARADMVDNTIQENNAATHGGGLYVQGGQLVLDHNRVLSNTAGNWGGGLMLYALTSDVRCNTFQANTAGWRGGGIYAETAARFDGNLFLDNAATDQGGGAFLYRGSGAILENSVFVGNQAAEGGGLYLWAAQADLVHSTIADNISGDGRAVVIDKYPGLVNPGAPTVATATVVFSNSIVAGQPVGFFATAGNELVVDGILWHAIPTHFDAAGADVTVRSERTGDPAFQPDGYHLRLTSAALDVATSALDHDVDGHLRNWGSKKDLGADERVPAIVVDPDAGGTVQLDVPQQGVTITVKLPRGTFTKVLGVALEPFPPLPPDVMETPIGRLVGIGPPFRLAPFTLDPTLPISDPADPPLGEPSPPLTLGFPAEVWMKYDEETLTRFRDEMDRMELQLLAIIDGETPAPARDPACGPVDHDLSQRQIKVPICDTGIPAPVPAPTSSAQVAFFPLRADQANSEAGIFLFAIEIAKTRVYLPLIMR
jgi:predicted outer membrane repeat protein